MPGREGTRTAYSASHSPSDATGSAYRSRTSSVPGGTSRPTRAVSISARRCRAAIP